MSNSAQGWALAEPLRNALSTRLGDPARRRGYFLSYCVGCLLGYVGYWFSWLKPGFPWGGPGDFVTFYTGASLLRSAHPQQLYDLTAQAILQVSLLRPYGWVLPNGLLPFVHPPFFAALVIPFTYLPMHIAFLIWNLVSFLLLLASIKLLLNHQGQRSLRNSLVVLMVVLAFFPIFQTLQEGQGSFLVLFGFTLAYLLIKRGSEGWAGFALALGLIKPQLVVVIALVLLFKRRWRALSALCGSSVLLTVVSWLLVGTQGIKGYFVLGRSVMAWNGNYGFSPTHMFNLRGTVYRLAGLWQSLGGPELPTWVLLLLTGVLSAAVLVVLLHFWKGTWAPQSVNFDLQFVMTLVAALLLAPYLHGHDLSLLVLAGFIAFSSLIRLGKEVRAQVAVGAGHCAFLASFFFGGVEGWVQVLAVALIVEMAYLAYVLRSSTIRGKATQMTSMS